MPSEKILRPYQPRLALSKATLWDKLSEPTRARVRQFLVQMLQQVIVDPEPERSHDEHQA